VPRKIRQLKADLRNAGFVELKGRGKGSHTVWEHPVLAGTLTLSGNDGDDARPYQERNVQQAITATQRSESAQGIRNGHG
jgi:hypothetical protein